MTRRIALFIAFALACTAVLAAQERMPAFTVDNVPNVHVADARQHVSDPAGLMPAGARDSVNVLFGRLEAATGIETAVVVLPSIGEATPFDFAQSLFRKWGIGKSASDNGLLILYVADQRSIRMHVGYGLEGFLTDAKCKRIQTQFMIPHFRRGDTGGGMVAGARAVCAVLDGSMKPERPDSGGIGVVPVVIFALILIFVLAMTGVFGRRERRCPNCGLRGLRLMSTDYYRAVDGRRMRKDVYVCGHCGRVTVENTPVGDDDRGAGSGLGAFLGGMFLGSMLGGRHGGGGGFSGGSFGGGDSGGGGAESNW